MSSVAILARAAEIRRRLAPLLEAMRFHPVLTTSLAAFTALLGLLPALLAVATGWTVTAAVEVGRTPGNASLREFHVALLIVTAATIALQAGTPIHAAFARRLGRYVDGTLRLRVLRASTTPVGICHLEDPELLDQMQLARGIGPGRLAPGSAVDGLFGNGVITIKTVSSFILLLPFAPVLATVLFIGCCVVRMVFRDELVASALKQVDKAQSMRRSDYYRTLALAPEAAKESRVFGLTDWLGEQYRHNWLAAMREVWRDRKRRSRPVALAFLVVLVAECVLFATLAWRASHGELAIGALAVAVQAALMVQAFCNVGDADLRIAYGSRGLPAVHAVERATADAVVAKESRPPVPPGAPRLAIELRGLSFTYPRSTAPVLRDLDLEIPAERSLAIVGVNGAGKTTLVKLLAGLYEPTGGAILVDGVDLREYDPRSWQRGFACLFQDFLRLDLSAAENVSMLLDDETERPATGDLDAAAEAAAATQLVAGLTRGWDTPLSRQYDSGAELSGGQWQRVGLARALYGAAHGRSVLILDEPTSQLDVRTEAALFDRFLDLTRGCTTILISHRFCTVRHADRIVVVDQGRVVETGTHNELIAGRGRYQQMFEVQAAAFRDPTVDEVSDEAATLVADLTGAVDA